MNLHTKKWSIVVTLIVLFCSVVISLVGCSSKNVRKKTFANKKEIVIWEDEPLSVDDSWKEIFYEFEKKNPDVTVIVVHYSPDELKINYKNAVLGGIGPNAIICSSENIGWFLWLKTIMPNISNVINTDFAKNIDQIDMNCAIQNGNLCAVPIRSGDCRTILYDKKFINSIPNTMNEFIDKINQPVKLLKRQNFVFDDTDPIICLSLMYGFGGGIFDNNGKINLMTEPMINAVKLIHDLSNGHSEFVSDKTMIKGNGTCSIDDPANAEIYKMSGIDVGIAPIPFVSEQKIPAACKFARVLMLNPNLKEVEREVVNRLVQFITNKENQEKICLKCLDVPANKEAKSYMIKNGNALLGKVVKSVSDANYIPTNKELPIVLHTIKTTLAECNKGNKSNFDAKAVCAKMQEEVQKNINKEFETIPK